MEKYYSVSSYAKLKRKSTMTIYNYIKDGLVKYIEVDIGKIGKKGIAKLSALLDTALKQKDEAAICIAQNAVNELMEMQFEPARQDIMAVHAQAYTAEEINLIADYFSKQPK